MNEKMKKFLMRELYMGAVALAMLIIVFVLCTAIPSVKESAVKTLAKDTDLEKVVSLLREIIKEM